MMISLLDTSVCDNNLGNRIIMESVRKCLEHLFPTAFFINLPYLDDLGREAIRYTRQSDYVFLGGTNALSGDMQKYRQIGINAANFSSIENITLLGVGWWQYQAEITEYTATVLRSCLHTSTIHSVRDSYTKEKLTSIGIQNVVVTGCPTIWSLSQAHCERIPTDKSKNVLVTFTNYSQDASDCGLVKILKQHYEEVFVWVQGPEDLDYAKGLGQDMRILPPNLKALDALLQSDISLEYIGTRLHAGIRALQCGRRALIIGVDNRALEKRKDFNLPVLPRTELDRLPDAIHEKRQTQVRLPQAEIEKWMSQFPKRNNDHFWIPADFSCQKRDKIRVQPVSRVFGLDRGVPIDRFYIENFLARNASAIRGRVLEIAERFYTEKYGREVTESDVLNVTPTPSATIVGDLSAGRNIPQNAFDCIILTQTIQCVYDFRAALLNTYKALRPSGTLLLTASGISQISRYDMDRWGEFWRFTDKSLRRILTEIAPDAEIEVQTHGNVTLAKAFLDGLALHELPKDILDFNDPDYQVVLTARVCKPFSREEGQRISRRTTERQTNLAAPIVLLYHRIAEDPVDAHLLSVSPANFEEHLKVLSQEYRMISLFDLLQETKIGRLSPNTIAITFDDGYRDVLTNGLPLLEKYRAPATIFVTSGKVGASQGFWWDIAQQVFFDSRQFPAELIFSNPDDPQHGLILKTVTRSQRLAAHDALCELMKRLNYSEIEQLLRGVLGCAGREDQIFNGFPILIETEIERLAASPLIEIGAHTVTHTKLSVLHPHEQRSEIVESKRQLEAMLRRPIRFFSYPFGSQDDFTQETKSMVMAAGFFAGIANFPGSLAQPMDAFAIPRHLVRNWQGKTFLEWLKYEDKSALERKTREERRARLSN